MFFKQNETRIWLTCHITSSKPRLCHTSWGCMSRCERACPAASWTFHPWIHQGTLLNYIMFIILYLERRLRILWNLWNIFGQEWFVFVCLCDLPWTTHRSRTGIRYPALIFYPSVVRPLFVGVRAVKHSPYFCHAVHTHCWATENGAERKVETRDQITEG